MHRQQSFRNEFGGISQCHVCFCWVKWHWTLPFLEHRFSQHWPGCSGVTTGQSCEVSCADGFLPGNASLTCDASGGLPGYALEWFKGKRPHVKTERNRSNRDMTCFWLSPLGSASQKWKRTTAMALPFHYITAITYSIFYMSLQFCRLLTNILIGGYILGTMPSCKPMTCSDVSLAASFRSTCSGHAAAVMNMSRMLALLYPLCGQLQDL